ncbi:MAG: GAF domain-containing protein [Chitinophagaceae bacterium]|nr:GAF domain-containing protein [Chitinophagaceae bacterium]
MKPGNLRMYESLYNSRLSLRPLIEVLKKTIDEGRPGAQNLYGSLLTQVEATPELMEPITDMSVLERHAELVENLLSTIFPPTNSEHENLYAVALPFQFQIIYSSKLFRQLFLAPGTNEVSVPTDELGENLQEEKLHYAYTLILKKYLGFSSPDWSKSVYPFPDEASGLIKYLELQVDTRFVDVVPIGEMPEFPKECICSRTNKLMPLEELRKQLPLEKFRFEGLAIVKIIDVTEQEAISRMKNSLLKINSFSDAVVYKELQDHMQSLIGLRDIRIGITPFFKVNGHYVYSELYNSNSLLFKHLNEGTDRANLGDCCKYLFEESDKPIVFEDLDPKTLAEIDYMKYYYEAGARSVIISPLKHNGELIGILEIIANQPHVLKASYITRIEPAIPLFTLALERSAENLDNQIDKVIKEKFTAVQPSVEWKFTETAFNYIQEKQQNEDAKMSKIVFDDVYPFYGAIDIRNSSTERAQAIQLDLIEQLQMAKGIVTRAQAAVSFPLLQEIEFKIEKYISSASDTLLSDDEIQIHDFLQRQLPDVFDHLNNATPSLKKDIADYYAMLDPQAGTIYHHRQEFEESMGKVNDIVSRFIDKEQIEAQKVFPHYFERYVTDGVEFNVYIGQSMAPRRKFDNLYLRNMKMWQLSVLAKAARITHNLAKQLPHPLATTQLILAHSIPISISFRNAERKFDVDGAYNIRYEIIKKRIDKVRIKNTMERLTQPGKLAIVYSQPKEATEYREYIEFLQNQQLLKEGIEEFELEDLQGVVGLKALRVEVVVDEPGKTGEERIRLSNLTTNQLLGK